MLTDRDEESVQQSYVGAAALWMAFVPQVCQIAFEQLTIELLDVLDADRGQEPREPADRHHRPGASGFQAQSARQPQPDPALGQLPQPWLGDPVELQGAAAVEAEAVHPPDIARVFGFPAAGLGQIGDGPARIKQQSAPEAVVDGPVGDREPGALVVIEQ
jgi:hypothetical protein